MKRMILATLTMLLCLTIAGAGLADTSMGATDWYEGDGYYYEGAYYYNTFTSPQTVQTLMRVASRSGPGTAYTAHKNAIAAGTEGIIYGFEDGWVLFEFYNADKKQYRRVWMPIDRVEITGYVTY